MKVVLIGDSGVGKTAIFRRFEDKGFDEDQQLTVGASCCNVTIESGGTSVDFMIWDTAGQEQFRGIIPMYFHKTDFILAVYDLNQRDTFTSLADWLKLAKECAPESAKVFIIGSKCDVEGNRVAPEEVAKLLQDSQVCRIFDTSALTGYGIHDVILEMANMAREMNLNVRESCETIRDPRETVENKGCC